MEFMHERHFIFMTPRRKSIAEPNTNDGDAL
jgi:hypothetical protein